MLKFKRAPNEIYSSESEEEININEIPAYILESNDPPKLSEETPRLRQVSPPPPQKIKSKDQSYYRKKVVPESQPKVQEATYKAREQPEAKK